MQLIEILLPLYDNEDQPFPADLFTRVRNELTERFGGLTVFSRAPAQGLWNNAGETRHDDIVVFEVMTREIDPAWWATYRHGLEQTFRQHEIVVRAHAVLLL